MMAAELTKRSDLGQFLNALGLMGRGAEIGVYRGDFSREVLAQWHGVEWCLIDPWVVSEDYLRLHGAVSWDMEKAYAEVQRLAASEPRVRVFRTTSTDWRDTEPFDVVYIDGSHDYQSVSTDLHHWWRRLKPGGLLCGHDYLDEWRWSEDINKGVLFGVRSAVDRFATEQDRVVATTSEEFPTWWLLKPARSIPSQEIAVLSMSTSDVPWAKMTVDNHKRYCDRWGYRYRHVPLENETRPASWAKLRIICEALQSTEFVLWMDCDAIFQRFDLSLQRFWDGVSPFVFFKDQINGLNMGVFFARRCPETFAFLERWDGMTEFNHHKWWENGAILEIERRNELIGLVLPHRLGNSYPHLRGCWSAQDFIAHVTGLLPSVRTAFIRDFVNRTSKL